MLHRLWWQMRDVMILTSMVSYTSCNLCSCLTEQVPLQIRQVLSSVLKLLQHEEHFKTGKFVVLFRQFGIFQLWHHFLKMSKFGGKGEGGIIQGSKVVIQTCQPFDLPVRETSYFPYNRMRMWILQHNIVNRSIPHCLISFCFNLIPYIQCNTFCLSVAIYLNWNLLFKERVINYVTMKQQNKYRYFQNKYMYFQNKYMTNHHNIFIKICNEDLIPVYYTSIFVVKYYTPCKNKWQ